MTTNDPVMYPLTVSFSQLAAENAAKAVTSIFRVTSWSHYPSRELLEAYEEQKEDLRGKNLPDAERKIRRLAEIADALVPEHGRSTYRELEARRLPDQIYDRADADEALRMAEEAVSVARTIVNAFK
ncbi:MAG: DNA-binding protein [Candidatus Bathyarchaeia archaeon]